MIYEGSLVPKRVQNIPNKISESSKIRLLDLFHKSFFTQFQIIDPSN